MPAASFFEAPGTTRTSNDNPFDVSLMAIMGCGLCRKDVLRAGQKARMQGVL
jgi:hypothetical protein